MIAVETGYIPPNINFTEPRSGSKGLDQGMLKVVVEKTPFADTRGLIGEETQEETKWKLNRVLQESIVLGSGAAIAISC